MIVIVPLKMDSHTVYRWKWENNGFYINGIGAIEITNGYISTDREYFSEFDGMYGKLFEFK